MYIRGPPNNGLGIYMEERKDENVFVVTVRSRFGWYNNEAEIRCGKDDHAGRSIPAAAGRNK
jgi:hypothetical protein